MDRLSNAKRASNSFGNEVKCNSETLTSSTSECFNRTNSIYGWFVSFNQKLLTSIRATNTGQLDGIEGKTPWAADRTGNDGSTAAIRTIQDDHLKSEILKETAQGVRRGRRDTSKVDDQHRRKKAVRRNVFVPPDELRYMNLATPNPKMEITIEVVDHEYDDDVDDDETDDDWVSQPLNEEQVKSSQIEENDGSADGRVADISTGE